jgi:hypothetical protein
MGPPVLGPTVVSLLPSALLQISVTENVTPADTVKLLEHVVVPRALRGALVHVSVVDGLAPPFASYLTIQELKAPPEPGDWPHVMAPAVHAISTVPPPLVVVVMLEGGEALQRASALQGEVYCQAYEESQRKRLKYN